MAERNVMDILLGMDVASLPEKDVKIKRLSNPQHGDVVFHLRALPYNKVAEITEAQKDDMNVHIVLAGVTNPNLKDKALLEHFGAPTPAELLKKLLLPGEIEDLSREVEKLSGYRTTTIEEVKKN